MTSFGWILLIVVSIHSFMITDGLRSLPPIVRHKCNTPIVLSAEGGGFGSGSNLPRPKIITPSVGSMHPQLEKFLMMYTCKICTGRNAQMVSKVAYSNGMVVSTCRHCKSKHLIADNEGKLDMGEYGKKIEEYLVEKKGEKVQRVTITAQDLENNYLVDTDGVITLVSKSAGQLDPGVTVIEMPGPSTSMPPSSPPSESGGGGGFKTKLVE